MEPPPTAPEPGTLSIDIWSDVMCPFCYLGDAHLELALQDFEHRDRVRVTYHSYLLAPDLPEGTSMPMHEMLAQQKGVSVEQARQMDEPLIARGTQAGVVYAMDEVVSSSTRRAHELSHLAQAHGKGREMMQRLFRAYFTEGRVLDDVDVLSGLAEDVGLDRAKAAAALQERTWRQAVEDDMATAQQLGISGVPFFVLQNKYAVSGAQPPETMLSALRGVWEELADESGSPRS